MAKLPIVLLDAGHGGSDSGAVNGARKEKDDNLKLVLAVGKKLNSDYEVSVKYTRKTDIFETPTAKKREAEALKPDLFVSIHRNSYNSTSKGYETLVYSNEGIKKELADKLNKDMEKLGFYNRGTKVRKDLAVLKASGVPAVLLEVGFISNKADNNLFDDKFNKIVAVIVKDIADVMELKTKKKATVKVPKKFAVGDYNDYAIITATLNVRAGRGTEHEIMGVLAKNTKVKVLYIGEKKGTLWGSIDYGKSVGYISLNYAKPVE